MFDKIFLFLSSDQHINAMQQTLETSTRKELLRLINGIFLVMAVFSALGILISQKLLPQFTIEIGHIERSLTSYFLQGISFALTTAIYLRLLTHKAFRLKTRSRIGLCLMIISLLAPLVTEPLYAYGDKESWNYYSLIYGADFLINAIGLILFIGGCDIDKKLRRFIKWTPFISLGISCAISFSGMLKFENGFLLESLILTTTQIFFCLIIHRMSRKEMPEA